MKMFLDVLTYCRNWSGRMSKIKLAWFCLSLSICIGLSNASNENIYGDAQIRCYVHLTNYVKAERTRTEVCRKFYALRDCMVPRISRDQKLVAMFEQDLVPYVKRYRCDGGRKVYEVSTRGASKNGPGRNTESSTGDRSVTPRDKVVGARSHSYNDATVTVVIIIGVLITAGLVATLIYVQLKSTRTDTSSTKAPVRENPYTKPPKDSLAITIVTNHGNATSRDYENVQVTSDGPSRPPRSTRNKTSGGPQKHLDGQGIASKLSSVRRISHQNFKKLSESDSDASPSYLSKEKTFQMSAAESSIQQRGQVQNQIQRYDQSPLAVENNGINVSPGTGRNLSPGTGRNVSPVTGRNVSPATGRNVSPATGRNVSPATGRSKVGGHKPPMLPKKPH